MNKQDEILISKYLDGELSGDELKFVENLIIEDEEAALHYKMHQDTFSLLTKEYENPSYQAAKKRLENLVTHHKAETDTKAWSLEQIFPFSNLGSILSVNNALVASFSLALAFLIVPSLFNSSLTLMDGTYEGSFVSYTTRSADDKNILDSPLVKLDEIVISLIDSEYRKGEFISSDGQVIVANIDKAFEEGDLKYYYGFLEDENGNTKDFSAIKGKATKVLFSK